MASASAVVAARRSPILRSRMEPTALNEGHLSHFDHGRHFDHHDHFDHRRFVRNRFFFAGGGWPYYYDYGYDCWWLRRQAVITGSPYWWLLSSSELQRTINNPEEGRSERNAARPSWPIGC